LTLAGGTGADTGKVIVKANRAGGTAGETPLPSRLLVGHDVDDSVVELAVHGQWTHRTAVDVYQAMRKSLAEHPCAVIIDLHGMRDLDGRSASTWIAAGQAARTLRPPAQIALCVPPTRQLVARLRRLGCTRFLSLFVSVEQARAAVASAQAPTDRLQLRWLPSHAGSLTAVGDVVGLACRVWAMCEPATAARAVALDMVRDSITHAGTAMLFTISRRGDGLYLALRDREPTLPPLRHRGDEPGEKAPGRLSVMTAHSCLWGASATHDGKVVWAVVRSRPRPSSDEAL
jgi:hypothetical protein